jgi:hypothetical protein
MDWSVFVFAVMPFITTALFLDEVYFVLRAGTCRAVIGRADVITLLQPP